MYSCFSLIFNVSTLNSYSVSLVFCACVWSNVILVHSWRQSLVGLHSVHHLQLCSFQLSICMFFHTYFSLIIFLFCSALSLAVLSLQHLIIGLQSSYSISIFTLPFASLYADLTDRCPPPLSLTAVRRRYRGLLSVTTVPGSQLA